MGRIWAGKEEKHVALDRAVLGDPDGKEFGRFDEVVEVLGQLSFDSNGVMRDKVELAIQRLKAFEPPNGYYVAFSGGKDSQCIYHLCKMAGVKFDAHYNVTSVDPPELVQFIKRKYPDVAIDVPHDKDGKRVSMWSLIEKYRMPPTRNMRYCCANIKEINGRERIVVTGVRWAESNNRAESHSVVDIRGKQKTLRNIADSLNVNYKANRHGDLIMNDDNDEARRLVEQCYRTQKTMVNPIVDWDDDDVWEFLNGNGIEHCCLYNEGFKRLGCIGCPMGTAKQQRKQFARYPKYKYMYLRAFGKMLNARKEKEEPTSWKTPEEVMAWWLQEEPELDGQIGFEVTE